MQSRYQSEITSRKKDFPERSENTLLESLTQQGTNSFDEHSVDLNKKKKSDRPFSRRRSKQIEELNLQIFRSGESQEQMVSILDAGNHVKRYFTPDPLTSAG